MTPLAPQPLAALIETARLATLERYRQLPAACGDGLSRVCCAAAQDLGATQAAISLVDHSAIQLVGAWGFERDGTPRQGSFCDAVVCGGQALVVADGWADPRFSDHELVRAGPGLRSYAGVPLVEGGGYTLGTVAVYSAAPDRFGVAALTQLASLATLVRDFLAEHSGGPRRVEPPARRVQGWLGVKTVGTAAGRRGVDGSAGLLVVGVARGSPAAQAGLRTADILHSIGGRVMTAAPDVAAAMAGRAVGTRLPLVFRRAGQWHECVVEVTGKRSPRVR